MSNVLEQKKDMDITELVEVLSLDDELELDNELREWLQAPPIKLQSYGFGEPDSEMEYFANLNEISEYLMER